MDNKLKHTGVMGMKWGVRRVGHERTPHPDYVQSKTLKKKKVKELSNEELGKLLKRQDLERRYKDLNPSLLARGSKAAGQILKRKETLALVINVVARGAALFAASKQASQKPKIKVIG